LVIRKCEAVVEIAEYCACEQKLSIENTRKYMLKMLITCKNTADGKNLFVHPKW
jgi:hypothetical protein